MCVICYQICEACDEHQAERLTRAAARLVAVSIDDFEPEKKIEKDKNACMRPGGGNGDGTWGCSMCFPSKHSFIIYQS